VFQLAHLSDPHMMPLPSARTAELLSKRLLGLTNWQLRRGGQHRAATLDLIVRDLKAHEPQHVAVTGDLVNIALAAEFAPARAWLMRLGPTDAVTVVPGNHDVYVRGTDRHAHEHWGEFMRGDDGSASAFDAPVRFPFVRRRGPVALVGLSTAVATGPFMATGKLGADQLTGLSRVLPALAREGFFRVVLLHHPPTSPASSWYERHLPSGRLQRGASMMVNSQEFRHRIADGAALRHTLADHGAELVLHGHIHVHSLGWLPGPRLPIPVVGVPSASMAVAAGKNDLAAYNIYRVGGGPGRWTCEAISRGIDEDAERIVEIGRAWLHAGTQPTVRRTMGSVRPAATAGET